MSVAEPVGRVIHEISVCKKNCLRLRNFKSHDHNKPPAQSSRKFHSCFSNFNPLTRLSLKLGKFNQTCGSIKTDRKDMRSRVYTALEQAPSYDGVNNVNALIQSVFQQVSLQRLLLNYILS